MIYELQTVVLLEEVYRRFPKNEKELSVTAVIEFGCLTELNPCHIILQQYAKNVKV